MLLEAHLNSVIGLVALCTYLDSSASNKSVVFGFVVWTSTPHVGIIKGGYYIFFFSGNKILFLVK